MLDDTLTLALDTIRKQKQAIVFTPSRASAEKTAEDISQQTKLFLPNLAQQSLKSVSAPTKQCRRLSNCLKKGIAFHHAGLTSNQKQLIEQEFRNGTIKIICATPTLAMGLSLPAYRVIIKSLKRYSGRWGMDWIPVLEYHQMAGRAGRPEYEKMGEAITLAASESQKHEIHEKYLCGLPEDIYSKLAVEPVLRTYLLSLIATNITNTKQDILEFFSQTFWAHQFRDMNKLQSIIDKMLLLLEEWEFIKIQGDPLQNNSGFTPAINFNKDQNINNRTLIKATLIGQRISQLYLDPYTAHHIIENLKKSTDSKVELTPFSFLQTICNTLEISPLLRVKIKEHEHIQEKLVQRYQQLLESEPALYDSDYDDFINSIKTSLFFEEWIDEKDEDYLMEHYGIRPGEIHTKLATADWLLYSMIELTKLLQFQPILKELNKLRIRVKHGVKEELLPLLKLKGIGRKRARKLHQNKIKTLKELHQASTQTLSQLLGQKLAQDIKLQLENPDQPIQPSKRIGQLSIQKFK